MNKISFLYNAYKFLFIVSGNLKARFKKRRSNLSKESKFHVKAESIAIEVE